VRRLPAQVTLHTARMFMEDTTVEGESRMLDEFTMPAAEAIGTVHPHVVIFGCTSAGALRGQEYDRKLVAELAEMTGAQAISVIRSVQQAIERRGATRIGVITPYVDSLNEKIRASLVDDGLEVVGIAGLGLDENFAIAEVDPKEITDFAVSSFGHEDIDLLFASCTNFRAFDARDAISAALDVPVVTSNHATLEAVELALEQLA
jgi:maleate isomerase